MTSIVSVMPIHAAQNINAQTNNNKKSRYGQRRESIVGERQRRQRSEADEMLEAAAEGVVVERQAREIVQQRQTRADRAAHVRVRQRPFFCRSIFFRDEMKDAQKKETLQLFKIGPVGKRRWPSDIIALK